MDTKMKLRKGAAVLIILSGGLSPNGQAADATHRLSATEGSTKSSFRSRDTAQSRQAFIKRFDLNQDGQLDEDERAAAWAEWRKQIREEKAKSAGH